MTTIKLTLDSRRLKKDGTCPVKLAVYHQQQLRLVKTGICVEPCYWNPEPPSVRDSHPDSRRYNALLTAKLASATSAITKAELTMQCFDIDELLDIVQVSTGLKASDCPTLRKRRTDLVKVFERCMATKQGKTLESYKCTLKRIQSFLGDSASKVRLEDVNRNWLVEFDSFLSRTAPSPNSRAVYMRNLRAVFNYAIDEELTKNYPFRTFRIKTVKTYNRNLSIQELRRLWELEVEPWEREYRDMFFLTFFLIGINSIDLLNLPPDADKRGRIEYHRKKTKRFYSIKVEPEAQKLIDRYRGVRHMISPLDHCKDHVHYRQSWNDALRGMGQVRIVSKHGKKERIPEFPKVTTYWARHTWATIAAWLGIQKEIIALALGHGQNTVTDIYIDWDRSKVDDANRKVIDYVLYGKQ